MGRALQFKSIFDTIQDDLKNQYYVDIANQYGRLIRIMFDFEPSTGATLDAFKQMFFLEASGNYTNSDQELEESEITARVDMLIKAYGIETMWVGEMRGRTLSNSFIIVDEAQNMSNKTMQMVLSRIDSSCKVVVLGSNKQIDNFYVNKYTNALTTLLKSTKNENPYVNLYAIKLKKVLRGPITQWAESIF
jgi:hypothetical protein